MAYFVTFLEGLITFISPCMLPMLPIYITYFSGTDEKNSTRKALTNSIAFVLGFSSIFILMGASAGLLGRFLQQYKIFVNVVLGAIVAVFGLYYIGVIKLAFIAKRTGPQMNSKRVKRLGFFSSYLFGVIFSLAWSGCLSAFLGSALTLAASSGTVLKGVTLLACYSLGLGIPFILSALLLNQLRGVFNFIKRNYKTINVISGTLLIIMGIAMMTGLLDKFLMILA